MKRRLILHHELLEAMSKHRLAVPTRVRQHSGTELFACAYDLDALLETCYDCSFRLDLEGEHD